MQLSFPYSKPRSHTPTRLPIGGHAYLNDGFSPASDVLTDGYSTFTPAISETKGAASSGCASVLYPADASGNNWDAFGNLVTRS